MKHMESEVDEALAALTIIISVRKVVTCPVCLSKVFMSLLATVYSAAKELDDEITDEHLLERLQEELNLQTEIRAELDEVISNELKSESSQSSCKLH